MLRVLVLAGVIVAMLGATFPAHVVRGASRDRPHIVENGTDVVLFPPFPLDVEEPAGPLIFSSDGTAYYTSNETSGTVAHLLPDGTSTPVPGLTTTGSTLELYANRYLYFAGRSGLIRMHVDGTHRRFWQTKGAGGVTVGPGGNIYFTETYNNTFDYISATGALTRLAETYTPTTNSVLGPDGDLYFGSTNYVEPNTYGGVAKLASDGTEMYFALTTDTERVVSMAASRGALYFLTTPASPAAGSSQGLSYLWRLSTNGSMVAVAEIPQLYAPSTITSNALVVDQGGDLWFIDQGLSSQWKANQESFGFLYFFNVGTGHLSGPFEPGILDLVQTLTVGPDDNIWLQNGSFFPPPAGGFQVELGAYVRHIQTLEPASLTIVAGAPGSFGILETQFNGPWTAVSSNLAVAAVSPATSSTGMFVVNETGKGTTSIAVSDRFGNTSYEAVKAH